MANQIVKLKKGSDYLYPYADFMGIDLTNLVASYHNQETIRGGTRTITYTASEDCFFYTGQYLYYMATNTFTLNGVSLYKESSGYEDLEEIYKGGLLLKKGDVIVISFSGGHDNSWYRYCYKVYGIKR